MNALYVPAEITPPILCATYVAQPRRDAAFFRGDHNRRSHPSGISPARGHLCTSAFAGQGWLGEGGMGQRARGDGGWGVVWCGVVWCGVILLLLLCVCVGGGGGGSH